MSSNLCISCHARPKFVDGSRTHNFCGKTCARKGQQNQTSSALPGNCDVCHMRPKYSDGTRTHNYCSRTCARNAPQAITPTASLTTAASQASYLVEIQTNHAKFAESESITISSLLEVKDALFSSWPVPDILETCWDCSSCPSHLQNYMH